MKNFENLTVLLTFVILIVAVTSTIWTDYRLKSQETFDDGSTTTPDPGNSGDCYPPGPFCDGCNDLYMCDEKNQSSKVWTCGKSESCKNGQCISPPSFECIAPIKDFLCQSEGLLPDPGDCFKYHLCAATVANDPLDFNVARTCLKKGTVQLYSYNARTGYCDKKMNNSTCPSYPVPLCTKPLQRGALTENPSIYFTCKEYVKEGSAPTGILYPYLQICDNGKQYDANTFTCK